MIDLEQSLRAAIEAATKTSYDAVEAAIQALYDELAKAHAAYADAMADRLAVVRGEKPARGLPDVADAPPLQRVCPLDDPLCVWPECAGRCARAQGAAAVARTMPAEEAAAVEGAIKQAAE